MLPFGARRLIGFIGDNHKQHERANVTLLSVSRRLHARRSGGKSGGRVDSFAEAEIVIGVAGGEGHAGIALTGADHLHRFARTRAEAAIVHGKKLAFQIAFAAAPEVAQHGDIFGEIVVAPGEIVVAGPQAHLLILRLLPAGHQVDAEAAFGDGINGGSHARHDGWRQRQCCRRSVDFDA